MRELIRQGQISVEGDNLKVEGEISNSTRKFIKENKRGIIHFLVGAIPGCMLCGQKNWGPIKDEGATWGCLNCGGMPPKAENPNSVLNPCLICGRPDRVEIEGKLFCGKCG